MAFESKMADDDTVIEKGDVKVIMDSQSAPLLQGAEVDYVDSSKGPGSRLRIHKRRPRVVAAAPSAPNECALKWRELLS
jgi:Fe-S cluster assembly iron-binding protein IscA